MASALYNAYKNAAMTAGVNLTTDTIKIALFTSSYTPNLYTDTYYSGISANESTGTGYTAGGATLTSPTLTVSTTGPIVYFNAANVAWSNSTIANARYAVIYKSTGNPTTSVLIALVDFGSTQTTTGDTFQITWSGPNGIFYLS